jgi:hypothetical protein
MESGFAFDDLMILRRVAQFVNSKCFFYFKFDCVCELDITFSVKYIVSFFWDC